MPGYVHPTHCDLCGASTGTSSYDVHMVLQHPETRPVAKSRVYSAKELRQMEKRKARDAENRRGMGRPTVAYEAPVVDID
jgi:hypothetical protein